MDKKIRVVHAITRLDKGGASENTLLTAIGLAKNGYEVDILYGKTKNANHILIGRAKEEGVRFYEERSLIRNIRPVKDLIAFIKIHKFFKKRDYDIIHTHSHKAGLICRFAAKAAGIKKIVYTPHGHVFYGYFNKLLTYLIIIAERCAAMVTDKIIGLTPAECDEWISFGIGNPEKYISIPSGLEFDALEKQASAGRDWRKELGIAPDKILAGSIGRFTGIKGYEYFIQAGLELINKREDMHFLLVGDGELENKYKDKISKAGAGDRFHVVSWQENTGAIIKALDIFVLSSINEGMGRVLIEAMYFSKPIIATRVGGVPSVINQDFGILIDPSSPEAISEAIETITLDMKASKQKALKGKERAINNYSALIMLKKTETLYQQLFPPTT